MRVVVADTSPIRYLLQINHIDLLPKLFGNILIPSAVADELRHLSAPVNVQSWIQQPPDWLRIMQGEELDDPQLEKLDPGERAAIALGLSKGAHLILIDDRAGVAAASNKGIETTGTLGILDLAAGRRLIRLSDALEMLKRTNFRYRQTILDQLLKQFESGA